MARVKGSPKRGKVSTELINPIRRKQRRARAKAQLFAAVMMRSIMNGLRSFVRSKGRKAYEKKQNLDPYGFHRAMRRGGGRPRRRYRR